MEATANGAVWGTRRGDCALHEKGVTSGVIRDIRNRLDVEREAAKSSVHEFPRRLSSILAASRGPDGGSDVAAYWPQPQHRET